jgi:hypothetical protein
MTLMDLVAILMGLAGWPALVSIAVNVLKWIGWIKEGMAPKFSLGFNVIGLALIYLGVVQGLDIAAIDSSIGTVAALITAIWHLLVQLGITKSFHNNVLRGAPVIGHSHSLANS